MVADFGAEVRLTLGISAIGVVALLRLAPSAAFAVTAVSGVAVGALLPGVASVGVLAVCGVAVLLVSCTILARCMAAIGLALRESSASG